MLDATAGLQTLAPPTSAERRDPDPGTTVPPPRVLLVVEGCYPVAWGGVSTWCDSLMRGLPDLPFHVVAIVPQPGLASVFEAPSNLVETITVPLWNLHDVGESWPDASLRRLHAARSRTSDADVLDAFLPPLHGFVRALLESDPDLDRLAHDIHALHRFLVDRDLGTAMHHPAVWAMLAQEACRPRGRGTGVAEPRLWELTTAFQWITRWLYPLARPLPEVDVVHLAMAGMCSLVGVAAALEYDAGLLLTEHGVYLRERYLAEATRGDSDFLKRLALGFALRMTQVTYRLADQVSPCCDYNQRWELRAGADPRVLETIYYGLDSEEYRPEPAPRGERPTIVWVGRINPLKDVETLLRAAAIVVRQRPDVLIRLYGDAPPQDAEYHRRCLDLHAELGLAGNVEFAGYTSTPTAAYAEGDFVVLSSVSEGFPYSILEAMFCGRPVVASAVGGIPEQVLDTGITVEPRNPEALAAGMLRLLEDPDRVRQLGAAARERAATMFAATRFTGLHRASYLSLSPRHPAWSRSPRSRAAAPAEVPASPEPVAPEEAFDRLVEEIGNRVRGAQDSLEVTALIESTGITDPTARRRYGFPDTFALGEAVFHELRRGAGAADAGPAPGSDEPAALLDTARRPALALLPTAALLAAVYWISASGNWLPAQVLALVTGITTGMVCTTGIALALVRRGSILVSLGKRAAVRRFIGWGVGLALCSTALVALVLVLPRWNGLEFVSDDAATFTSAALSLSVVWALATCLSLVAASGWTGLALLAGVGAGLAVDRLLAPLGAHLTVSVAVGMLVTVALMLRGLHVGLERRIGPTPSPDRTLPAPAFLVLEGLPYAAYGTVAVVLFFAIHVVGGLYLGYRSPEVLTLEFGLFLPLAPSLLALGTAERLMRTFWLDTRTLQHTLPAARPQQFGAAAYGCFRTNTRRFLLSLTALSLAMAALVYLLSQAGVIDRVAPHIDADAVRILFVTSLAAYGIFSWAQFNGTYCLALGQWVGPVRAAGAGLVVTIVAGLVLVTTVGYAWLAVALGLGSAVYGAGTRAAAHQVLLDADHHYATTV